MSLTFRNIIKWMCIVSPTFFFFVRIGQERFLASYPTRQAASIDLDNTVYAVAAFYLCARKIKVSMLLFMLFGLLTPSPPSPSRGV